jgi:hypothetical protein
MSDYDTSFEARFDEHTILENGTATIPNLLMFHYRDLGLTDGHFTLLAHVFARKWTRESPYPTIAGLPMDASVDTRRKYVRDLRNMGLLFTGRLYWTNADKETNKYKYIAKPGKLRSNVWYLGNLLHNIARIHLWLEAGNRLEDFRVEIKAGTVKAYKDGEYHDVPEHIKQALDEHIAKNGCTSLLLEKHIVEQSSTMGKASSRKASTRKTHRHEEETESNKNQSLNKNQIPPAQSAEPAPPAEPELDNVFGPPAYSGNGQNGHRMTLDQELNLLVGSRSNGGGPPADAERIVDASGWDIRGPDGPAIRQALIQFLTVTKLELPNDHGRRGRWYKELKAHVADFKLADLPGLYRDALKKMRDDGLTVSAPGSLTEVMAAIQAERKGKSGSGYIPPGLSPEMVEAYKQHRMMDT